ncbi:hypothetical protein JG688_00004453 [Phytophthora aleatoria]|uniref:Uncharacterized protein n=1 Tax=Phytophthora aleatoria TaxID=2496075 RepID=A0A8J5JE01_9STRA|nr:hypothetical protein JG688_00004453 [Phytophthora aleatoria]
MSTAVLASLGGTSVRRDVLDFVGPESTLYRPNFWTRNLVGCSGDVDEGGFRTDLAVGATSVAHGPVLSP